MIDLTFLQPNSQIVHIKVASNKELTFYIVQAGFVQYTTIEGLKLNPTTIVEKFPDLAGKPIGEIRAEGIKRFKEHIAQLATFDAIKEYLKQDLGQFGWKLILEQRKGWRARHV